MEELNTTTISNLVNNYSSAEFDWYSGANFSINLVGLISCVVVLVLSVRIEDGYRYVFGNVAFADALTCLVCLWTLLRLSVAAFSQVPALVCRLEIGLGQFAYFSMLINPSLSSFTRYQVICQARWRNCFQTDAQLRRLVVVTQLILLVIVTLELLPLHPLKFEMPSCQDVKMSVYPILLLVGVCLASYIVSSYCMYKIYQTLYRHKRLMNGGRSKGKSEANDEDGNGGGHAMIQSRVNHKRILKAIAIQTFTPILLALPIVLSAAAMLVAHFLLKSDEWRRRINGASAYAYTFGFLLLFSCPLIHSLATVALVTGYRTAFTRCVRVPRNDDDAMLRRRTQPALLLNNAADQQPPPRSPVAAEATESLL